MTQIQVGYVMGVGKKAASGAGCPPNLEVEINDVELLSSKQTGIFACALRLWHAPPPPIISRTSKTNWKLFDV